MIVRLQLQKFYEDSYEETIVSNDRITYTIKGKRNYIAEEGSDLKAILDDYVAIGVVSNIG